MWSSGEDFRLQTRAAGVRFSARETVGLLLALRLIEVRGKIELR